MPDKPERRVTLDEVPRVDQRIKLTCRQCGKEDVYNVGTIMYDGTRTEAPIQDRFGFTEYFLCSGCGGPGPFNVVNFAGLFAKAMRATVQKSYEGFLAGSCGLFDGTIIQTPALGEQHLAKLIEKEPENAFLRTRLGNLYRSSGQEAKAAQTYDEALRLDPGDVEARYHLFSFAQRENDIKAALIHGPLLVKHLLLGRIAEHDEEKTRGLAMLVVESLLESPPQFRERFLAAPGKAPEPPETTFIRTLLEQDGDEDEIVQDAVTRLLDGECEPCLDEDASDDEDVDLDEPAIDLVPSLLEVVHAEGLDGDHLTAAFEANEKGNPSLERQKVPIFDGEKGAVWPAPPLRTLFRGTKTPPTDIDHYPPEYARYFYLIETHVIHVCDEYGDRTDQELEEIYSLLRRRPDGRSLGKVHDIIWRVAALMLAMHPLSEAEFTGIFGALGRSTRGWGQSPVSRNYIAFLRKSSAEEDEELF